MIPAHGIYLGKRPNFRRDDLMNLGNINKNDLPRILRKYANADNVSTYLNRLRVEYAVKQMKSKPFLSFDAIPKKPISIVTARFIGLFTKCTA